MEILHFNNFEDFACIVADELDNIIEKDKYNDNDIAIVAKYEEARQLIKELVCIGYDIESINIRDAKWGGYDDEYIISISNIGDEYEIWCEPMLRENGYFKDESTIIYIFDNCSSKVIPYCKGKYMYEVSIGEYDSEDDENCDLECDNDSNESESVYVSRTKEGTPTGFQKTWYTEDNGMKCWSSYSHYNSDVSMLRNVAKEFGVKL